MGMNSYILKGISCIKHRTLRILDNISFGSFGKSSKIVKPMRILGKKRMFIGDNVIILNNGRLETIKSWGSQFLNGKLTIGNNTSFQQCCHIIAANSVEIGDNCVFSAFVYISDCSHRYAPGEGIMESALDIAPVKVGNHCFVGIGSCIMPGVELGDCVVVGANSVVTKNVPAYCMVAGSPAKVIKHWDSSYKMWLKV